MSNQYGSKSIWVCLILSVILCYTFSLLWGWIPLTRSILTLMVGWMACLFVSYRYFTLKPTAYIFIYTVVVILNVLTGDHRYNSLRVVFDELTILVLPSLMFYGIINNNKKILNLTVVSY
jgi:hypothetical protein